MAKSDRYLGVNYTGRIEQSASETKVDMAEKKREDEADFDLNGDGKIDGKDASIAGKVLANRKKKLRKVK